MAHGPTHDTRQRPVDVSGVQSARLFTPSCCRHSACARQATKDDGPTDPLQRAESTQLTFA